MTLEKKDEAEAKSSAAVYKRRYAEARTAYFGMESPTAFNERIMADATAKKNKMGVSLEDIANIQKAANEEMAAYQLKFEAARKEMDQAKHLWDLWNGVGDELKRQREHAEKLSEAEKKLREERQKSYAEGAADFKAAAKGRESVNATEVLVQDVFKDRKLSAQGQFSAIAKELDNLRQERNKKLTEAYGINAQIEKDASKKTPEELKEMAKKRADAMRDAGWLGQRIGVLENALGNIRDATKAPDMSHVTSLAQYGFNMGERDRRDDAAERYYGQMTDLTRQIRDKLDEGVRTEAVYSE